MKHSLYILFCLFFLAAVPVMAQEKKTGEEEIFQFVEQKPVFPGGDQAMMQFLGNNIVYPLEMNKAGLEGLVVVSFVVNSKGKLNNIEILKKLHPTADEEVKRVLLLMPDWEPGRNKGKKVSVRYNLPVRFSIRDAEVPEKETPEKH